MFEVRIVPQKRRLVNSTSWPCPELQVACEQTSKLDRCILHVSILLFQKSKEEMDQFVAAETEAIKNLRLPGKLIYTFVVIDPV